MYDRLNLLRSFYVWREWAHKERRLQYVGVRLQQWYVRRWLLGRAWDRWLGQARLQYRTLEAERAEKQQKADAAALHAIHSQEAGTMRCVNALHAKKQLPHVMSLVAPRLACACAANTAATLNSEPGSGSCSCSSMAAFVPGGIPTLCWVGPFVRVCRAQIEGLQQQLQEEAEARNRMEEEMKRSFMRGEWCNLASHVYAPSFDRLHRPVDAVGVLVNTVCVSEPPRAVTVHESLRATTSSVCP